MTGRLFLLVWVLRLSISAAQSQEVDITDYLAQYNMEWTASHPYLLQYAFQPFYQASIRHENFGGDFRPAFRDQNYSDFGFHSRSQKAIKNWNLLGAFSYRKILDRTKPYLLQKEASSYNPYVIADNQVESWGADHIDFSLSAMSPAWMDRFRTYAVVRYDVSSGHRKAEPRPLYRHSKFLLEIGNQMLLNQNFHIGIGGAFAQHLEENTVGSFAVQDFSLHQLRGISTFTRNTYQAFQRNQKESRLTGKAFLSYAKNHDWGFLEFATQSGQFDARDGIAVPEDGGSVESKTYATSLGFNKSFSGKIWQTGAKYTNRSSIGIDPIFRAINYDFASTIYNARTSLTQHNSFWRQIAVDLAFINEQRDEIAGGNFLHFQNIELKLGTDLVLPILKSNKLWLSPLIGIRSNQKSAYQQNSTGLIGEIFNQEIDYYSSDALLAHIKLMWLSQFKEQQLMFTLHLSTERTAELHYNTLSVDMGLLF
ncbi:DUF6850 family outer membrane beta-barrel protein [Anditalea andensis]|uniref:DUF6850 domain-containing protein n=1 Tax=Anditalea andensis TaxID=1048983 RepID=A0A074L6N8_9BACT|nr:DUF6850 family outer membrane beta-barrel protein [Anditalea andensis]KEO75498.1 hypothetical protein EL17_01225 [Anditalea andensis]